MMFDEIRVCNQLPLIQRREKKEGKVKVLKDMSCAYENNNNIISLIL